MDCHKIKRLLSRYADNELRDAKTLGFVEEHIKTCASCKAELDAISSIKGLMSGKARLAFDAGFLPRLQEQLKEPSTEIRVRWMFDAGNLAKRLIPVPAILAILIIVLLFGSSRDTELSLTKTIQADPLNEQVDSLLLFSYSMFKN